MGWRDEGREEGMGAWVSGSNDSWNGQKEYEQTEGWMNIWMDGVAWWEHGWIKGWVCGQMD